MEQPTNYIFVAEEVRPCNASRKSIERRQCGPQAERSRINRVMFSLIPIAGVLSR
jgi:hypothetical protein